jgi:hypothetical protein
MNRSTNAFLDKLPVRFDRPVNRRHRRWANAARAAVVAALLAAVIIPAVQLQRGTMKNHRRGELWRQLTPEQRIERGMDPHRIPKYTRGAIGRWRVQIGELWDGDNIYKTHAESREEGGYVLHPNMPFTVLLLSPFTLLPVGVAALVFNLAKIAVVLAVLWMAADLARPAGRKLPDWVLGLGALWGILLVVSDIQHGNTNTFVLGAIVLHLWLYRRGRDLAAGTALTVAICLKMTPALFLLYWLYQRNWRLLAGAAGAMVLLAVGLPAAVFGPQRFAELGGDWWQNLIVPGLLRGSWYPVHINQSLGGVFSRYFLPEGNPNGDIFWNPDDNPYSRQIQHGWITLVAFGEPAVKWMLRGAQAAVVAAMAWAIGWRKLPRDDGRRGLHYSMIAGAILLLNQRTWDHHGAILLFASVPIWLAIAYGRMGRSTRIAALAVMLLSGPLVFLNGTELYEAIARMMGREGPAAERFADLIEAYGPGFYHFLTLWLAAVICGRALRDRPAAYAPTRQKLSQT